MDATSSLNIIYEDNHVIVCEKPPGVLSQADGKDRLDMLSLLRNYIKVKYNKPGNVYLGLVHRLDYNVGGVMVFAKTSKAASRLSESMRLHDFTKMYYAVLEADLQIGFRGVLEDYIAKDENEKLAYVTHDKSGKLSQLEYEVIDKISMNTKVLTLVKVTLLSGRFHQIRLQFSSRGMPLYGDIKYGHRTRDKERELGLYSYQITFPHPTTQELLIFENLPKTPLFELFKSNETRKLK